MDVEKVPDDEWEKWVLSHVTQHTTKFTVGPLDYCGIAHCIPTSGQSK